MEPNQTPQQWQLYLDMGGKFEFMQQQQQQNLQPCVDVAAGNSNFMQQRTQILADEPYADLGCRNFELVHPQQNLKLATTVSGRNQHANNAVASDHINQVRASSVFSVPSSLQTQPDVVGYQLEYGFDEFSLEYLLGNQNDLMEGDMCES